MKNSFFVYLTFIFVILNSSISILFSNEINNEIDSSSKSYLSNVNIDILSLSSSFPQMEKKTFQAIVYNHNGSVSGYIQNLFDEKTSTENIIFYNNRKKLLLKEVLKYNNQLRLIEKSIYTPITSNKKDELVDFSGTMTLNEKISFNYSENNLLTTTFSSKDGSKNYSINYSYILEDNNNNIKTNFKYYVGKDGKHLEKLPPEKVIYTYYINGIKLEISKVDLLKSNSYFDAGIVIRNKDEKSDIIESIIKINANYLPYRYIKYIYEGNKVSKVLIYKVFDYDQKWDNQFRMIPEKNLFLMYTFEYNYNIKETKFDANTFEDLNTHFINEIPIIREKGSIYLENQFKDSISTPQNKNEERNFSKNSFNIDKEEIENQIIKDKRISFN